MGKVFDVIKERSTDRPLDIHDYLVKHPASTFFMKMEGQGPEGSGVESGDVLVIDRAVEATNSSLAVVVEDGQLDVAYINKDTFTGEVSLWGVVVGLLRKF